MAFTQNINIDSQQTSPGYVLTFIRYSNRDTVNYAFSSEITRKPFVVVNDAVSVGVHYSKSDPVPTLSCSLKQGDINYLTAIHPGDYVFVNMVNWESKAMQIRQRALAGQPINEKDDGFKGLFKILDVNMALIVNSNGEKNYYVNVTARGFDEFNNVLYFNPALAELTDVAFLNNFKNWSDKVQTKQSNNVEALVKEAIKRSVGEESSGAVKGDLNQFPSYKIPILIPKLLGISAQTIAGVNKCYLGTWKATNSYNGSFTLDEGVFYKTGIELAGSKKVSFESFQNVKVWSLLQDFSNYQLNESYTCYRLAPDNRVYPSIIVRQKPFNTNHFESFKKEQKLEKSISYTKFLDLPRWKISPDIITSVNIGRSDHGRINFVVVNSKTTSIDPNIQDQAQIVMKNYVADKKDIERNGRKPYIVNCYYDYPGTDAEIRSKEWAVLIADWVFNGHLKMNGTIQAIGIQEPICVGDNLELDNVVYHIESITHDMSIDSNGSKSFRTNLTLSYGVDLNSNTSTPVYAEMDNTDSFARRKDDFKKEKLLPGFSDSQDWPGRKDGEEVKETKQASFTNPKPIIDPEVS